MIQSQQAVYILTSNSKRSNKAWLIRKLSILGKAFVLARHTRLQPQIQPPPARDSGPSIS
jgi:hypothetical protein